MATPHVCDSLSVSFLDNMTNLSNNYSQIKTFQNNF